MIIVLLASFLFNIIVIHQHISLDAVPNKFPYAEVARDMLQRHAQKRGILHHTVMLRLYAILQRRWELQQQYYNNLYRDDSTLPNRNASSVQDKVRVVRINEPLAMRNSSGGEVTFPMDPGFLWLSNHTTMSPILLEAIQQYNQSYHDPKQTTIQTCVVPMANTLVTRQRHRCQETISYTIIAVHKQPFHIRTLFLNILLWLNDPAVAEIRLILPRITKELIQQNSLYGTRIQMWETRHKVHLLYVAPNECIFEALARDATPWSTALVMWRDSSERVTFQNPFLPLGNRTETARGIQSWRDIPHTFWTGTVIVVSEDTDMPLTIPHWNGLLHHQEWLCFLATEPFRSIRTTSQDDWSDHLQVMAVFFSHLAPWSLYTAITSEQKIEFVSPMVKTLFGGFVPPFERTEKPSCEMT